MSNTFLCPSRVRGVQNPNFCSKNGKTTKIGPNSWPPGTVSHVIYVIRYFFVKFYFAIALNKEEFRNKLKCCKHHVIEMVNIPDRSIWSIWPDHNGKY